MRPPNPFYAHLSFAAAVPQDSANDPGIRMIAFGQVALDIIHSRLEAVDDSRRHRSSRRPDAT